MLPVNRGSHTDYQNFVVTNLRKYYPNPASIARPTWDIIGRFWNLDLFVSKELIHPKSLALAGDGTPVVTFHKERKHRVCDCKSKDYYISLFQT